MSHISDATTEVSSVASGGDSSGFYEMETISDFSDFKTCISKIAKVLVSTNAAVASKNSEENQIFFENSSSNEFLKNRATLMTELENLREPVSEIQKTLIKEKRCRVEIEQDVIRLKSVSTSLDELRIEIIQLLELGGRLKVKHVDIAEVEALDVDADYLQDEVDAILADLQSELDHDFKYQELVKNIRVQIGDCFQTLDLEPSLDTIQSIENHILPGIDQAIDNVESSKNETDDKLKYLANDFTKINLIRLDRIKLENHLKNVKEHCKAVLEEQLREKQVRMEELKLRQKQCKVREQQCSDRHGNCENRLKQCHRMKKRMKKMYPEAYGSKEAHRDIALDNILPFDNTTINKILTSDELPASEQLQSVCEMLTDRENALTSMENKLTTEENDIFDWEKLLMEKENQLYTEED